MMMSSKNFVILAIIAVTTSGRLQCNAHAQDKHLVPSIVAEHFETVVYSDTRFLRGFKGDSQHDESLNALRLPYLEMLADLAVLSTSAESDLENDYTAFIVGAKDFVTPTGLGLVLSHKCYVGIRESGSQPNLDTAFRRASYTSIAGLQAWTWSLPPYEGNSQSTPVYAAQIGSHYFILANNREDFQTIAQALATSDSATHSSLSTFDRDSITNHEYWAYRSIRRDDPNADTKAAALAEINSDVASLSFYADISKRQGFIRVLSSDLSMKSRPRVLPDSELGRFHQQGPGIWESPILLQQQDRTNLEALTKLMGSFGMGMFL